MAAAETSCHRSSVLSLSFNTCLHRQEKKSVIAPFRDSTTFIDIFDQYHDYNLKNNEFTVKAKGETVIASALMVGEVVNLFNIREFTFTCEGQTSPVEELTVCVQNAVEKANKQVINAFQLMMSGGSRRFPDKKTKSLTNISFMTAHLGCPRNIFRSIMRMVSGVQYSSSCWLLVLLLIRCPDCINTATIMKRWTKCQTSFESVTPVTSCPSTEQSYALRSKRMKCESYKTCGGEPCVYHCAMNPWGNATVEVCAPETLITGYYCPHFSTGVGRILEHYSYPCKDCPFNYLSTTSYKYKSCYNFIKTSEETKQIATATEQQTAKGISTAFVTKPNPCSGHQQGRNHRRLKRPVICGNSATTVISPTQKPPKEKISNSSLEGAILSRSTEMTDSGATDSNTRSEYETAIICGTVFGILTLIITIFIIVILLHRKGYASCADCSQTKKLKKKHKNYEGPETQDFLSDLSKQNIERQVPIG